MEESNFNFEESLEESLKTLNTGEIVKGTVLGVTNTEVFIDLGFKSDGVIPKDEFSSDPSFNLKNEVKIGDTFKVFIVRVNDGEGNVLLSKKKVDQILGWEKLEDAYKNKEILTGKVTKIIERGIIITVNNIDILIPASQVSDKYIKDFNSYLNTTLNFVLTNYNKKRRRFVGSVRVLLEEENKKAVEKFWDEIEIGKKYIGTVKNNMKFGTFVDLGSGIDGLIHISQLSWNRIKHPSEILKEGDSVDVFVIDFDKEAQRISLGYRKNEDNPWEIAKSKFNLNDIVKCKVVRMLPFGAFVELIEGVDGLIHISQIANKRIAKPDDVLSIGKEVEAKITEINWDEKKIGLSIKALIPKDETKEDKEKLISENKQEVNEEDIIPTEYSDDIKVTIGDIINKDQY